LTIVREGLGEGLETTAVGSAGAALPNKLEQLERKSSMQHIKKLKPVYFNLRVRPEPSLGWTIGSSHCPDIRCDCIL